MMNNHECLMPVLFIKRYENGKAWKCRKCSREWELRNLYDMPNLFKVWVVRGYNGKNK